TTTYGSFPYDQAGLGASYIMRDFRAQPVSFQPLRYYPGSKKLRMYTKIRIKVTVKDQEGENPFIRESVNETIEKEFHTVYRNRFLNYNDISRYTAIEEIGTMLIICH